MDLTPEFFLVAIPAVLIAGISKGGFAGNGAFMATPILSLAIEPVYAVALMLPLLLVIDIGSLRAFWGRWNRRLAWVLTFGGLIGVALGALVFNDADPDLLRLMIGGIALGFVAFQLARHFGALPSGYLPYSSPRAIFWSACAGLTSFISHAGGPPISVFMLRQKLSKTEFQATLVIVFWWINLSKLPAYAGLDMFDRSVIIADLILAPIAIIGTYVGVWAHHRVPEYWYFRVMYVFLVITGVKLIFDALT